MKRTRYTEPQIVFGLQQAEGGTAVAAICRKMGGDGADLLPVKAALCGSGNV